MAKHTQTIRREIADCLSVFGHFVNLALKRLRELVHFYSWKHYKAHGSVMISGGIEAY